MSTQGLLNYTVGVVAPNLGNGGGSTVASIAVTPNPASGIIVGNTIQFTATGTLQDNSTENLTAAVTWASTNSAIASFNSNGTGGGLLTGIAPGTINVTATLGTVVSPAVSVQVTFAADFTGSTLPSGITATRAAGSAGAKLWPVMDQGSALRATPIDASTSGSPPYESRSATMPAGWWNFRSYTNSIPDPFTFDTANGWDPYSGARAAGALATGSNGPFAPDGKSNAWTISVVQPFPDGFHFAVYANHKGYDLSGVYTTSAGVFSCWLKDNPANPANISAIGGQRNDSVANANWKFTEKTRGAKHRAGNYVANGWERLRVISGRVSGGTLTGYTTGNIQPSLLHGIDGSINPVSNAIACDADPGSVLVAGAQVYTDPDNYTAMAISDLPLGKGTIGATTYSLTTPSQAIVNGELDVSITFVPGWIEAIGMTGPGGVTPWDGLYIFSAQTPDGELSFRYYDVGGGAYKFKVRGTDIVTLGDNSVGMFANDDQVVTIRLTYKPVTTAKWSVGFSVNNVYQPSATGSTTGGALSAPTSFYLLGKPFADGVTTQPWQTPGMLTGKLAINTPGTAIADPIPAGTIVFLGDSLIRSNNRYVSTASYVFTGKETTDKIAPTGAVLALGGATLANQLTTWQASTQRGSSNIAAVVVEGGINDIIGNRTAVQIQNDYQSLISDIKTNNPTAKIIATLIAPAYQYFVAHPVGGGAAAMETIRQTVNTAISNGTITSIDDIVSEHIDLITDTDGKSLLASLNVGIGIAPPDGLHYATDGRRIHGAAIRKVLIRQGVFTP